MVRKTISVGVGDICYLKSGSPKLTIEKLHDDGETASVAWIVYDTSELKRATFPLAALELRVSPEE